uniref:Synaptonemal complex protein 2 Spt16M-like domain-containing protein n=1 Tax=Ciona savignyi TaxID=51511 RepID=H2Z9C5_CIOSA
MSTQVLITLNEILESQSNKGVTEIRNSLCSNPKFDQLCKEILCNINFFGDYSLQQLIIEAIIRLTSSGHRQHKSHEWNNDSQCAKLFRSISYQEFDKEARAYLNKVNQSTQDKWVLSYQCKSIIIGNLTFNQSDDCWLDLCFRSKVIGFSFSHGTKLNYALESLTREDVDSVEVKDNGDEVKLTVKTKQQISILFEDEYFPPDCSIISCFFEKSLDLDSEKLRKKVNFILAKVAKVSKSNSMVKRGENGIMRQNPLNQPNTLVPGANHKALMPSNTQLSQNVVATSQPGGSYKTSKSSTYP